MIADYTTLARRAVPDPTLPARLRVPRKAPVRGRPAARRTLAPGRSGLLNLSALLRDTPVAPPAMSPEEWREFLDQFTPHGVYALLANRLGAWPEDYRPPAEVMNVLKRQPSTRPRLQRVS